MKGLAIKFILHKANTKKYLHDFRAGKKTLTYLIDSVYLGHPTFKCLRYHLWVNECVS